MHFVPLGVDCLFHCLFYVIISPLWFHPCIQQRFSHSVLLFSGESHKHWCLTVSYEKAQERKLLVSLELQGWLWVSFCYQDTPKMQETRSTAVNNKYLLPDILDLTSYLVFWSTVAFSCSKLTLYYLIRTLFCLQITHIYSNIYLFQHYCTCIF